MGVCRPGFQLAERSGADLAIQLFSEKPQRGFSERFSGSFPKGGAAFFESIGMDTTTAIRIFLKQTLIQHKIPFEIVQDSSFYSEKNIKALEHSKLRLLAEKINSPYCPKSRFLI